MAAATTTFCYARNGYGFKKVDEYLIYRRYINRTYRVQQSLSNAGRRPLCTKMYFYKTSIRGSHYTRFFGRNLLKCRAEDTIVEQEKEVNISKATLIWRAIKLPMYTVVLIPITVGSAAAYLETGQYFGKRLLLLLASSASVMAWINLSKDVYDFDAGADGNKRESVVNLLGSRTGTRVLALMLLAVGLLGLIWVSVEARSPRAIFLLTNAIICGYIYQCPPFHLGYLGVGEPFCFAAFGPFATIGFYLLQSGLRELSISATIISSSILVGFTTTLVLFCSHFHQIQDDTAVGKLSPWVRLGTKTSANVVKLAVTALYALLFILGLGQTLSFSSVVLCALTLPMGNSVASFVDRNHRDKTKISMAKYYCLRLHTAFGAALAAGLVAARMFARKQLPHAIIL